MSKVTFFQAKRSHCLSSSSVLGAGARFSKVPIINGPGKLSPFTVKIEVSIVLHLTWSNCQLMKLNGVAYRDFRETGPRSFVCCLVYDNPDGLYGDHIKWVCRPVFLWYKLRFANPSDTMPAWSAHRLFLFKAFQPFLATYPHTFVLETLIDNVMLKFFYFSVLWNYLAYINSFFDDISHTVCEKTAIHSLVCLLRSLLLTTCSVIVQTSSTIWQFFGLNGQKTIKIDAWALAQTV